MNLLTKSPHSANTLAHTQNATHAQVGIFNCDGNPGQKWTVDAKTSRITSAATNPSGRCMCNGDDAGSSTVNVYSDLPTVELFVNDVSVGRQLLTGPTDGWGPSWATFNTGHFVAGDLRAVAYDENNVSKATHIVCVFRIAFSFGLFLFSSFVRQ
jgi:hypothetical protein